MEECNRDLHGQQQGGMGTQAASALLVCWPGQGCTAPDGDDAQQRAPERKDAQHKSQACQVEVRGDAQELCTSTAPRDASGNRISWSAAPSGAGKPLAVRGNGLEMAGNHAHKAGRPRQCDGTKSQARSWTWTGRRKSRNRMRSVGHGGRCARQTVSLGERTGEVATHACCLAWDQQIAVRPKCRRAPQSAAKTRC